MINNIYFLSTQEVLNIQKNQLILFGGRPGLRDKGLLESALNTPSAMFGKEYLHSDIYQMAAAYLYHIIKNHPFVDANKRTGTVTALTFLKANDIQLHASQDQIFNLAVDCATSKITKEQIAKIIQSFVKVN